MRRRYRWIWLAALLGCDGDGNTGPNPPPGPANIAGVWVLEASVANVSAGATCTMGGDLVLTQTGTVFTGTLSGSSGACADQDGPLAAGSLDGPLRDGTLAGEAISYTHGVCSLAGTTQGNRLAGTLSCVVPYQGDQIPVAGTWEATR